MSDVWKIGQKTNATDLYGKYKNTFLIEEVGAAKILTSICDNMALTYTTIVQDQNSYLTDIEISYEDITLLEEELQDKIKELEQRIAELFKKQEDGTITDEEKVELNLLFAEIQNLKSETGKQVEKKQEEIKIVQTRAENDEHKSKKDIATNYGQVAIEKGTPLSETKDKSKSFWRKTFGGWNKSEEREAGKNLIQAGNNLLEQVNIASSINDNVLKKTKDYT